MFKRPDYTIGASLFWNDVLYLSIYITLIKKLKISGTTQHFISLYSEHLLTKVSAIGQYFGTLIFNNGLGTSIFR